MLEFIQNQILFYITLVFLLFLPGYFFLLAVWGKNNKVISLFERLVVSLGLSIILVDFMMLILGRVGIKITKGSIITGIVLIILACYAVYKFRFKKTKEKKSEAEIYNFSKNQIIAIFLILFLAIFIRTLYLDSAIFPSSTDLGHHMYWANEISETGKIPDYAKRDIIQIGENYQIGAPQKISDVIIGEHLIFAAINLVSGINYISYFPVLTLFLIDIMGLLALFMLAFRMFSDSSNGKKAAILTLLLIGPVFAISPPQAKFVGGGVVGNIIGNLLIVIAFYFFIRFLKEYDKWLLAFFLIFSMGIFYTHHMTGFIFLLSVALFIALYVIFNLKNFPQLLANWKQAAISWPVIVFIIFLIIFFFGVYIPSYLTNNAVNTVVGEVTKQEHTGLTLQQLQDAVGESRLALGIAGIILFFIATKNISRTNQLLLFSWIFIVTLIAVEPNIIKINIPSGRVANYGSYPLSILSAFALAEIFSFFSAKGGSASGGKSNGQKFLSTSYKFILPALILIASYFFINGLDDNAQNLISHPDPGKANNTFHASAYLASTVNSADNVLIDHVYLPADSWVKIFFMRDYNFPFYRANPDRYENGIDKNEKCTYWMVTSPETTEAKKCFNDLNMNYIMVNNITDGPQFERTQDFSKIYSGPVINIYSKNFHE